MPTIAELFDTLPQLGKLEWIGIRPGKQQPMLSQNSADLTTKLGLAGDRYKGRSGDRQITLLQAEHLPVIASLSGCEQVPPDLLRRNLLVSGINLLALKDKSFYVGSVELVGTGLCHPCSRMEDLLGPGGYNALRGHGGITARVVSDGQIKLGDTVARFEQTESQGEYQGIDCADYDHLEIACMENYLLQVELPERMVQGEAVTLQTRSDGEFLQLRLEGDGSIQEIRVDGILRIVVLSKSRRFDARTFSTVQG